MSCVSWSCGCLKLIYIVIIYIIVYNVLCIMKLWLFWSLHISVYSILWKLFGDDFFYPAMSGASIVKAVAVLKLIYISYEDLYIVKAEEPRDELLMALPSLLPSIQIFHFKISQITQKWNHFLRRQTFYGGGQFTRKRI